ncbi:MAG: hypothetical protein LH606_02510 [Cytophagaceae bacterium]|nr:hypothetical protein [Cytophagaceae bacterium]
METPATDYKALDAAYLAKLETVAVQRQKAIIQYFNEFRELHTASGLIRTLLTENQMGFVEMANGDRIRLDRIISLNGQFFPGYEDYDEALGARCSL